MTWVRVDDGFADDPAMLRAGPLSFTIAVWALCYSSRHLTDGRIDIEALVGCPWVARRSALDNACERLEVAGFWIRRAYGYELADPLAFLQKADDVREKRRANADRQARWRERQQARRNGAPNGVTAETRNAPPVPTPMTPTVSLGVDRAALGASRQLAPSDAYLAAAALQLWGKAGHISDSEPYGHDNLDEDEGCDRCERTGPDLENAAVDVFRFDFTLAANTGRSKTMTTKFGDVITLPHVDESWIYCRDCLELGESQ